jgi:Ser/Thr protein kinase RdoA (MazF antagonist)
VALRTLHSIPAPPAAAVHDAIAEQDLLREQLNMLEDLQPLFHRQAVGGLEPALGGLEGESCGEALLHRDLHDKQVMIDARGRAGLLDFDTVARGEPALDLANMLAHLDLRVMQRRCTPQAGAEAGRAFIEGYAPSPAVLGRVPEYRAAALLRLACVYSYRPPWRHLVSALAEASRGALAHAG